MERKKKILHKLYESYSIKYSYISCIKVVLKIKIGKIFITFLDGDFYL